MTSCLAGITGWQVYKERCKLSEILSLESSNIIIGDSPIGGFSRSDRLYFCKLLVTFSFQINTIFCGGKTVISAATQTIMSVLFLELIALFLLYVQKSHTPIHTHNFTTRNNKKVCA